MVRQSLRHPARIILVWLVLALLLAACDNQPVPTPTPGVAAAVNGDNLAASTAVAAQTPPAEQPPQAATAVPTPTPAAGTLLLWHTWAGAEGDALAAALAAVQTQYPGVQIETLFVAPDDLLTGYVEAVQGGTGPDLLLAPNWEIDKLVEAGALLALDSTIPSSMLEQYWPGTIDSLRVDGTLYGLPVSYQTVALLVNANLVDASALPTSTDAWLAAARSAPTNGIGLYANLFHLAWGLPAYGATLFDDTGRVVIDQTGGTAAFLTWLQAVNQVDGSYVSTDYGMLLDRFKKGEFGYLVDGPWALPELSAALGDALQVIPIPPGPAGLAQPWLYTDGLFVNPALSSGQQDLALFIAQALTTGVGAQALTTGGNLLPAARGVDLSGQPRLQGFAQQAATAIAMPTQPEMEMVWGYGGDMIVKTLTGLTPPPAIVAETAALINEANGKGAAN